MREINPEYNQKNKDLFLRLKKLSKSDPEYISLRNEIWLLNRKLIFSFLLKEGHFCTDNCEYNDVIQECEIYLMKAIEKFDPDKGASFTTYAWYYIVRGIKECMNTNTLIHIPTNAFAYAREHKNDKLAEHIENAKSFMSLEEMYEDEAFLYDTNIEDVLIYGLRGCNISPEKEYEDTNRNQLVKEVLSDLKQRERDILHYYYVEEKSFEEIGRIYHLTRGRIQQIAARAIEKCRAKALQYKLNEFI